MSELTFHTHNTLSELLKILVQSHQWQDTQFGVWSEWIDGIWISWHIQVFYCHIQFFFISIYHYYYHIQV